MELHILLLSLFFNELIHLYKIKKSLCNTFRLEKRFIPNSFLLIAQMNFEHLLTRFSLCILFPVLWFFIVLNENQKNKLKEIIK